MELTPSVNIRQCLKIWTWHHIITRLIILSFLLLIISVSMICGDVCFFSPSLSLQVTVGCSDVCFFCKKRVYVMERLSAEGLFFHRSCFQCDHCSSTLRPAAYAYDQHNGQCPSSTHFSVTMSLVKAQFCRTVGFMCPGFPPQNNGGKWSLVWQVTFNCKIFT